MTGHGLNWHAGDYADVRWQPSQAMRPLVDARGARVTTVQQGERVSAWIVVVLLFACTAVSLFDLALLLTS
jgi:hypothetical protein